MADIYLLAGPPGAAGDKGPLGDQGPQGDAGPTGTAGTAGTNGTSGTNGTAGAAGAKGPTGDAGATGATGAAGVFSAIALHDTTSSPIVLTQLSGSLADTSGNSHNLTYAGSNAIFSDVYPGVRGNVPDRIGSNSLTNADVALQLLGDVTVACIMYASSQVNIGFIAVAQGGDGDTGSNAQNRNYALGMDPGKLTYLHEHSGPHTDSYSVNFQVPIRQTFHYGFTRISNVIQFYVNGLPAGAASSALTAPTSGTGGRLSIGGIINGTSGVLITSGSTFKGVISSVKIIAGTGLSASQMKSLYNNSMAARFPQQP